MVDFCFPHLLVSTRDIDKKARMLPHFGRKTPIPQIPSQVMDGKNYSRKSCAVITGKTMVSKPGSCAFTMFTGRWALTKEAKRKLPRPFQGKLLWRGTMAKSKSGETESKLAHSCMSTIALKGCYA